MMAWWWWMLVVLALIVGVFLSVWFALSAFQSTHLQSWVKKIPTKPKINFCDHLDEVSEQSAIVLMVVGNQWKTSDSFQPVYVFGTDNLKKGLGFWTEKINHDYQAHHRSPFVEYLEDTKQKPKEINFYVWKTLKNQKNLSFETKTLIKRFQLDERGFNRIFADYFEH